MLGYDDPALFDRAIDPEGWLHTGDVGRFDAAGNLTITDRLTDMYIVNGFNVYPAEIENVLRSWPKIATVAVVGVTDERAGETGVAFVVPRDQPVDAGELQQWCEQRLADFKIPRHVRLLDDLPVNDVGKPDKKELRRRFTAEENQGGRGS